MTKEAWLEKIAKRVLTAKPNEIKAMAFVISTEDSIETIYATDSMYDKLVFAGIIQQDAMLQAISASAENDEEEEADE